MIFKKVLDAVEMIRVKRSDSDHVDRLNHRWTSILLVVSCLILTSANYGNLPMFCWCPAYFVSAYEKYAQKICWVSETYNIVDDRSSQAFPAASRHGDDRSLAAADGRYYDYSTSQRSVYSGRKKVLRVSYYQWIPLLLLLQSFFFYLPGLVWKTLAARSGLDLANIVEASDTVQNAIYPERREKTLRYMSRHINRFLTYQNNFHGGWCRCLGVGMLRGRRFCFCCGNRFGNYLSCLYIGLKVVNLTNIIFQVLFIDFYLGSHFHLLGIAFLHGISTNQTPVTATAIASNHPAIAHVLTNGGPGAINPGYASSMSGHVVKREAGKVEFQFPESEDPDEIVKSNLTFLSNKSSHRELQQHQQLLLVNAIISTTNRRNASHIGDAFNKRGTKAGDPATSAAAASADSPNPKTFDRGRRATNGHKWSQKQRKLRRPISASFDWSTYLASLRSFPYLSSKLFPKITYCDFTVRQMTTFQLFTTQCVLSINFINEKLFLLLWFWFCLLFLVNAYSLIFWSVGLFSTSCRENYIRRRLAMIQRRSFEATPKSEAPPRASHPALETPYDGRPTSTCETSFSGVDAGPERTNRRSNQTNADTNDFDSSKPPDHPCTRETTYAATHAATHEITHEEAFESFTRTRLKADGIFILKILATNATRLVELEVLSLLWSVHERRLATSCDPLMPTNVRRSERIESIAAAAAAASERRDTVVDVTELRKARAAMSERDL